MYPEKINITPALGCPYHVSVVICWVLFWFFSHLGFQTSFLWIVFSLLIMNRNTFLAPTPWYWVCSRLFLALILGWTTMVLVLVIVLLVWLIIRMVWVIVRMVWVILVLVLVIVLLIWVTVVMVLVISSEGLGHIQ